MWHNKLKAILARARVTRDTPGCPAGHSLLLAAFALPTGACVLFGAEVGNDDLLDIESGDGFAAVVGPFGPSGVDFALTGLAYNQNLGVLYGSDNNSNTLFTYDVSGGTFTTATIDAAYGSVEGLGYDPADGAFTEVGLIAGDGVGGFVQGLAPCEDAGTAVSPLDWGQVKSLYRP